MKTITKFKALKNMITKCSDMVEELEQTEFSELSFLSCEEALNFALGYHGEKSWNDMIKEVETLKSAETPNPL